MKPNASTKFWNSNSRCSLPSTTAQPSGGDVSGIGTAYVRVPAFSRALRADDLNRRADAGECCDLRDVSVLHADAAVADIATHEFGMVGAVDRDLSDPAAEAVQHIGEARHAELIRPVHATRVRQMHDDVHVEVAERCRCAA